MSLEVLDILLIQKIDEYSIRNRMNGPSTKVSMMSTLVRIQMDVKLDSF
jgi:hypothetical protein